MQFYICLQYVSCSACKFKRMCEYKERGKKAFPASTFMCDTKIYCLPENNGKVELVQEDFLLMLHNFLKIKKNSFSSYLVAGWKWTNDIPSNKWQQYVMVVKKSSCSGEILIYENEFVMLTNIKSFVPLYCNNLINYKSNKSEKNFLWEMRKVYHTFTYEKLQ